MHVNKSYKKRLKQKQDKKERDEQTNKKKREQQQDTKDFFSKKGVQRFSKKAPNH